MATRGIDVSEYQGAPDWDRVRASGVEFATVRAGYSLVPDRQFGRNLGEARRTMGRVGFYYAFTKSLDAVEQADHFLSLVGELQDGEYLAIDSETSDGPADVPAMLRFLVELEAKVGRERLLVYTSVARALQYGFGAAFASRYKLWIAHWGVQQPRIPAPWTDYAIWQTGAGAVDGIIGPVDLDIAGPNFGRGGSSGDALLVGFLWLLHHLGWLI
jgi:GH25 family lysozyme M1 (1,4-beta-N-acetylmuramidase)